LWCWSMSGHVRVARMGTLTPHTARTHHTRALTHKCAAPQCPYAQSSAAPSATAAAALSAVGSSHPPPPSSAGTAREGGAVCREGSHYGRVGITHWVGKAIRGVLALPWSLRQLSARTCEQGARLSKTNVGAQGPAPPASHHGPC